MLTEEVEEMARLGKKDLEGMVSLMEGIPLVANQKTLKIAREALTVIAKREEE